MNSLRKTVTIFLATAALSGIGAGVAAAATPVAVTSHPQAVKFFNASPYSMFVAEVDAGVTPFATIQPGQSWTMPDNTALGGKLEVGERDSTGAVNDIDAIEITGYQPGVTYCHPIPRRANNQQMGCTVQTPDALSGENGPMQVSIWTTNQQHSGQNTDLDANTGDKAAMGDFLSGLATLNPAWVTFNPDVDTVSWGYGAQTLAGQAVWNCDAEDANEQIGGAATHEESTNVTGTFGITQGVKLFDTVDTEINASISVGHTWTDSTTDSYTIGENIAYHNVGWLGSIPSTETVSGAVTALTPGASPVVISNISFTEPGLNKTNNPAMNYQYVTHARPMTSDEITTYCGGSSPTNTVKKGGVVIGGTVPDVTAGAR
ncbi:hypothetical protein [Nakamurella sp.]|uniref:hypothetical protein n=1 Tax=Nakamurella sp. TaxID=1869182 RepID=UPI003B3BE6AD